MRRITSLSAGLLLGLSVVLCSPTASAQKTLTFGGSDSVGSLLDRQNVLFTKLVNERAAGKVKINFIQGEQLGNDQQVIEQMIAGSVHIYGDVLDWYANWVKDFAIMGWGFTFRDANHLQKFTESAPYQKLADELRAKQGIRILAASATQPRIMFANKPIAKLEDIAGIKMRVPEIKVYVKLFARAGWLGPRCSWA